MDEPRPFSSCINTAFYLLSKMSIPRHKERYVEIMYTSITCRYIECILDNDTRSNIVMHSIFLIVKLVRYGDNLHFNHIPVYRIHT